MRGGDRRTILQEHREETDDSVVVPHCDLDTNLSYTRGHDRESVKIVTMTTVQNIKGEILSAILKIISFVFEILI